MSHFKLLTAKPIQWCLTLSLMCCFLFVLSGCVGFSFSVLHLGLSCKRRLLITGRSYKEMLIPVLCGRAGLEPWPQAHRDEQPVVRSRYRRFGPLRFALLKNCDQATYWAGHFTEQKLFLHDFTPSFALCYSISWDSSANKYSDVDISAFGWYWPIQILQCRLQYLYIHTLCVWIVFFTFFTFFIYVICLLSAESVQLPLYQKFFTVKHKITFAVSTF